MASCLDSDQVIRVRIDELACVHCSLVLPVAIRLTIKHSCGGRTKPSIYGVLQHDGDAHPHAIEIGVAQVDTVDRDRAAVGIEGPQQQLEYGGLAGARDLARDIARTDTDRTSRRQRKKGEMLFAHLKRILHLDRLRLRGPTGARDEFRLAATVQNLRKLAKLIPVRGAIVTG